ncbi:MAG: transcriptional regulator [bacterium]|nr:transcriptional regulator [bacterium]
MTSADSSGGIAQLGDVDPVIHAPARLMIVTALYVVEGADFVFLQKQTGLTRGNLSSHLMKLEDAKYIAVDKKFVHRTPRTVIRLTYEGRAAFETYRRKMTDALKSLPG